jgi:glycosidase
MILSRAYNRLKPGRNFFESIDEAEFLRIRRETGADAIWLLDIFEIGQVRRWGTGGGSPYAIRGYRVKPELGGDEAFRDFVRRAHAAGMRVMTDFIPNHVSLDGDLVAQRPEATLHIVPPQDLSDRQILDSLPRQPYGSRSPAYHLVETGSYPENGKRVRKRILVHHPRNDYDGGYWVDMAQLDYSRRETRDWEIEAARRLFEDFGVDAVRRDMAYYEVNANFFPRWGAILNEELGWPLAPWARAEIERLRAEFAGRAGAIQATEFWRDFTDAVKSRVPAAFAIDEVYSHATDLSRAGSGAIYNKNDHDANLGQIGLYDAMISRNGGRIRAALRHAAFRLWQVGGAALVQFIGTHDGGEGNPWDKFGPVARAAAALALMLRPILVYNGVEQGVGREANIKGDLSKSVDREKSIPFDVPVSIDWSRYDEGNRRFLRAVLEMSERSKGLLGWGAMEVLTPKEDTPIVAYTLGGVDPETGRRRAVLVAANFSQAPGGAVFRMDGPVLKPFGAFEPEEGKSYILRDYADPQADGSPKTFIRSGSVLRKEGIGILLAGGSAHVMEISEEER